jgi:hypothetical protein
VGETVAADRRSVLDAAPAAAEGRGLAGVLMRLRHKDPRFACCHPNPLLMRPKWCKTCHFLFFFRCGECEGCQLLYRQLHKENIEDKITLCRGSSGVFVLMSVPGPWDRNGNLQRSVGPRGRERPEHRTVGGDRPG